MIRKLILAGAAIAVAVSLSGAALRVPMTMCSSR